MTKAVGQLDKRMQDLKNTHKQFLSDTNEYGIAGAANEHRQRDRTAEENAEMKKEISRMEGKPVEDVNDEDI